jgi:hypothetical protein
LSFHPGMQDVCIVQRPASRHNKSTRGNVVASVFCRRFVTVAAAALDVGGTCTGSAWCVLLCGRSAAVLGSWMASVHGCICDATVDVKWPPRGAQLSASNAAAGPEVVMRVQVQVLQVQSRSVQSRSVQSRSR